MDRQTFTDNARACTADMYKIGMAMLRNPHDAEDAAAEALSKAWEKRESLKDISLFKSWLIRILINVCKDELRRRKAHPVSELTDVYKGQDGVSLEARDALDRLDLKYRLAFTARFVAGYTVKETALSLGITEHAARRRSEKARKMLRIMLKEEDI